MENEVYKNPETGEELFRDVRHLEYEYKGIKFYVDMPGWFPKDNDEGIFTQDDMKVYQVVQYPTCLNCYKRNRPCWNY